MGWEGSEVRHELRRRIAPGGANYVKTFKTNECFETASAIVFVESFILAWVLGLIFAFTLQWDDILIDSSRRGARVVQAGDRPGRKRTKRGRRRPSSTHRPRYKTGTRAIFVLVGAVELVGFMFLLVAIPSLIAHLFQSFVHHFEGCKQPPANGPLHRVRDKGLFFFPGTWQGIAMHDLIQNDAGWPNNQSSVTLPSGVWDVAAAAKIRLEAEGDLRIEARLRIRDALGFGRDIDFQELTLRSGQETDIVLMGTVYALVVAPVTCFWEWQAVDPQVPICETIVGDVYVFGLAGIGA